MDFVKAHSGKPQSFCLYYDEATTQFHPDFGSSTSHYMHAQWDRKLDGRLAQAVMAVQAIKGVEIGLGFEAARRSGSMRLVPCAQVSQAVRYSLNNQVISVF